MRVKDGVYYTLTKTDKHGNRHYRTNRCKKCGGTGNVGYTLDDGRCWRCMGTGIEAEHTGIEAEHTVIGYTPEQIQLRREKATAKRLGTLEQQLLAMGFDPETRTAYRPIGNTFAIKDAIKDLGGVWDRRYGWWTVPTKPDFCESVELTMDDLSVEEYGEYVRYCVVRWRNVPGT